MKRRSLWSPRRRGRKQRRGLILILGSFFASSACLLCALAVDVGHLAVARAELQRSADAAALASAAVLQDRGALNQQPDPVLMASRARDVAVHYAHSNPCRGVPLILPRNDGNSPEGDLVLGEYDAASGDFNPHGTDYNAAHIILRRDETLNGPIPLIFGGLLGLPSVSVRARAGAFMENKITGFHIPPESLETSKLLPFSLQIDVWDDRIEDGEDSYSYDPETQTVTTGRDEIYEVSLFPSRLKPGNFGTVNLGSTANSASTLRRQILHGPNAEDFSYFEDNTLQLDENGIVMLNGNTGITASMMHELEQILGQPRIVPLHAQVTGQGNNAWFEVVAFVGIVVLDIRLTGALDSRFVQIQPEFVVDGTAIGGGNRNDSLFVFRPPRLKDTD